MTSVCPRGQYYLQTEFYRRKNLISQLIDTPLEGGRVAMYSHDNNKNEYDIEDTDTSE